jgi:thiol-disulfide isomerase/thioredoxin
MAGYLNHFNPKTILTMKHLIALVFLTASFFTKAQDKNLPQVELSDLYGQKVDLSTITNGEKIIVIDFWATWCIPCKKSLNNMLEVEKEWKEKYNAEIVAISLDDARNTSKVKAQVEGAKWPYKILLDPNQDLRRLLNFQNIPFSMLVDKNGNIVYMHQGYVDGDEFEMEEQIKKIADLK